jgi:hypothetical protein
MAVVIELSSQGSFRECGKLEDGERQARLFG